MASNQGVSLEGCQQLKPNIYLNEGKLLGKGATGNVYLGYIFNPNFREVAIKSIPLKSIDNDVTEYLLHCEISALQTLGHSVHPSKYIVTLFDVIFNEKSCFIVTELLSGGTLAELIKKNKQGLNETEATLYLRQIIEGYSQVNKNRIVHRDIKPDNLLFRHKDSPKELSLIDFGYCTSESIAKKPTTYYNVGSPRYMAPESYMSNIYSSKSDLFAIGVVFYELLFGTTLDVGKTMEDYFSCIRRKSIPFPKPISQKAKKIITALFSYNAEERYSCDQVLAILNDRTELTPVDNFSLKTLQLGNPTKCTLENNIGMPKYFSPAVSRKLHGTQNQSPRTSIPGTGEYENMIPVQQIENIELRNKERQRSEPATTRFNVGKYPEIKDVPLQQKNIPSLQDEAKVLKKRINSAEQKVITKLQFNFDRPKYERTITKFQNSEDKKQNMRPNEQLQFPGNLGRRFESENTFQVPEEGQNMRKSKDEQFNIIFNSPQGSKRKSVYFTEPKNPQQYFALPPTRPPHQPTRPFVITSPLNQYGLEYPEFASNEKPRVIRKDPSQQLFTRARITSNPIDLNLPKFRSAQFTSRAQHLETLRPTVPSDRVYHKMHSAPTPNYRLSQPTHFNQLNQFNQPTHFNQQIQFNQLNNSNQMINSNQLTHLSQLNQFNHHNQFNHMSQFNQLSPSSQLNQLNQVGHLNQQRESRDSTRAYQQPMMFQKRPYNQFMHQVRSTMS